MALRRPTNTSATLHYWSWVQAMLELVTRLSVWQWLGFSIRLFFLISFQTEYFSYCDLVLVSVKRGFSWYCWVGAQRWEVEKMRGWRQLLPCCSVPERHSDGESNWRADRRTEVLLLCHWGKSATLGLSKNASFCVFRSFPSACPEKRGSRGTSSHHAASPVCTALPRSGGEAWLPLKMQPVVVPRWVQSQIPVRHTSLRCLPRAGTRLHPRETDRARWLWLRQPPLALAIEHLAHSAHPSRHGKCPQPRKQVQKRSGLDKSDTAGCERSSGIFQDAHTSPCDGPHAHFTSLAFPVSRSQPGKLCAHTRNSEWVRWRTRDWAACWLTWSKTKRGPVWFVSPAAPRQSLPAFVINHNA